MYRRELTWPQRGRLWLRLGIRLAVTGAAGLLLWKAGPVLLTLFMPFVLAFGAAVLLNGPVDWLQKRLGGSRRGLALCVLLVIFGLLSGVLGLLVRVAVREAAALGENWPSLASGLEQAVYQLDGSLRQMLDRLPFRVLRPDQSLTERAVDWVQDWLSRAAPDPGNLTAAAREGAKDLTSFLLALAAFLMGSYLMCADYPNLREGCVRHMDRRAQRLMGQLRRAAVTAFGGYLKAQLLLSAGVFGLLLGGFLLTGQSYALLLALSLAVLDFIPLVGAGIVMVPWSLIALVTGQYERAVSVILIWGAVAVFRRVAEPRVVGSQTGLSPILSLISIYAGMKLGGVAGMILSPILTLMALKLLGLGLLEGVRADLSMAVNDVLAILGSREGPR